MCSAAAFEPRLGLGDDSAKKFVVEHWSSTKSSHRHHRAGNQVDAKLRQGVDLSHLRVHRRVSQGPFCIFELNLLCRRTDHAYRHVEP